ncbi:protoporphyrinogen oxidase [Pseudalkalibacillus salsuginis]|uniref:protoporphyrinogen oxidase n=1 Tax=Pseudalkalibacillus salsuginis TaxID=2910972 RepID=UPI001F18E3D1|nr:protoporphyrinogen oxidase [Pseudalkalibacillus salsuginis]MCF6411066.1 protoporphyrinogen oxidase [Pseudalkalibacillus salsuginis]
MKHVVIVGGGITGLSAAFSLQNQIDDKQLPIKVTLIEAESRLGGKIQTEYHDDFVIERGPDSYLGRKKAMTNLIEKLGIDHDLVNNHAGQAFILHGTKLYPMPEGAVMGVPTEISPFLSSGLFSLKGKARAGLDLILPKTQFKGDQSVGGFFKRRLGDEVVDNLIEPLLSGVYAGNIDKISLESTFPQFQDIESRYRSLILGMKHTKAKKREKSSKGPFLTLKKGLSSLVGALEDYLNGKIEWKMETAVEKLYRSNSRYTLQLSDGTSVEADKVIVTVPGRKAAAFFDQETKGLIGEVPATSVATIAMAFLDSAIPESINGTGFVVSKKSPFTITACTWTNQKWPHTTPEGYVLLRCYVGREHDQEIVGESDETILSNVLADLHKIMSIDAKPEFFYITRWKKAMPQYLVGHRERKNRLHERLETHYPGIQLIGASLDGIGLPDCVVAGENAADHVIKSLT